MSIRDRLRSRTARRLETPPVAEPSFWEASVGAPLEPDDPRAIRLRERGKTEGRWQTIDPRDDSPLTEAQKAGMALQSAEVSARHRAHAETQAAAARRAADAMSAFEADMASRRLGSI